MIGKLCAILCGIALTWACAATGLFLLSGLIRHGCLSNMKTARAQVVQIENILLQYRIEHQRCPATREVLIARGYIRAKGLVDPWGKDIGYSCSDGSDADSEVTSAGRDGIFGTADDVRSEP